MAKEFKPVTKVTNDEPLAPEATPPVVTPTPVAPVAFAPELPPDLTDVAVLHDLRKKGLVWRFKCDSVKCWLTVASSEAEARKAFAKEYPKAEGKIKATKLEP